MLTRIIQTKFWQDSFISELDLRSKLLFLYLFTNEHIKLTGAYELPMKYIAVDTGLTIPEITNGLKKISSKIEYWNNWVIVKNSQKYQNYSKGNENQKKAFEREFFSLPREVREILEGKENETSRQLVGDKLSTKHKYKIRNKKTKIKKEPEKEKEKIYLFKDLEDFKKNKQSIVEEIKRLGYLEVSNYFDRVVGYCETNINAKKYLNLKKVVINWLNKDDKKKQTQIKKQENNEEDQLSKQYNEFRANWLNSKFGKDKWDYFQIMKDKKIIEELSIAFQKYQSDS